MAVEKQKLILISGVVLGIAAIVMTKMYMDQQRQAVQEQAKKAFANMQANQSAVLVAKQDIPKGSTIESDMMDSAIVPNKFVQPQAVTSLDRISGMVTVADISKGEQITLSKLVSAKQAGGGSLAAITPAGKRAISVAVDNMASLAGMVMPGDYVDVIAMLQVPVQTAEGQPSSQITALPLFQNVLVLAMGQNTGGPVSQGGRYAKQEAAPSGPTLATLALDPPQASLLAFVQEQGKIRLTLRSPIDTQVQPIPPASWESLFQYVFPQQQVQKKGGEQTKEESVETVEIYRGLKREKMPLSN